MAIQENNATGETLRAMFSREVVLYDQAQFLAGQLTELLRGRETFKADALNYGDKQTSEMCDHPIEDGTPVSDHKIIKPREFTLTVALPAFYGGMVLRTLERYYKTSSKIIVKCATGVYRNMILTELPVNITPNDLERPKYDLAFREVLIVTPQTEKVNVPAAAANPGRAEDKDTVQNTAVPKQR